MKDFYKIPVIVLVITLAIILLTCKKGEAGNTVTDIDGNVYNEVTIGTQVWMKENLKITKYLNGDPIITGLDDSVWSRTSTGAYAIQDDNYLNTTYGKFYNWYAVTDSRKLCPSGWHVPNDVEWSYIFSYLGGADVAGRKMKESGNSHWVSSILGVPGTNESGFSGLPGGCRSSDGIFCTTGTTGTWWSSTEIDLSN